MNDSAMFYLIIKILILSYIINMDIHSHYINLNRELHGAKSAKLPFIPFPWHSPTYLTVTCKPFQSCLYDFYKYDTVKFYFVFILQKWQLFSLTL